MAMDGNNWQSPRARSLAAVVLSANVCYFTGIYVATHGPQLRSTAIHLMAIRARHKTSPRRRTTPSAMSPA